MEPVARAKNAFFACLGASVAVLLLVDFYLGPAAFAVAPPAPPAPSASIASIAAEPSAPPSTTPIPTPVVSSSPPPETTASAAPKVEPKEDLAPDGHYTGVVAVFEFEQANADLEKLKTLAKQMHADTTSEIVLEGHSDPAGNEYRNLTLSLDRANWCADRLVEYGINRMRIRTVGLGSARTIVDLAGDAGSVNRRVEVRWVMKPADGGGR